MGCVLQQDLTQIPRSVLGEDRARISLFNEQGQSTRVVDVGVAQDHRIDVPAIEGKVPPILLFFLAVTLDEPAVQQDRMAAGPQNMA